MWRLFDNAMTEVFIGVGSNIDRERNIVSGLSTLRRQFGPLQYSPVYRSAAVGFEGEDFLNLVVRFDSVLTVGALSRALREIEGQHGRSPGAPKFSSRALDLDILLYGDAVGEVEGVALPRAEVLFNAFVLQPLADIAPSARHPVAQQTYRELWQDMAQRNTQRLQRFSALDGVLAETCR